MYEIDLSRRFQKDLRYTFRHDHILWIKVKKTLVLMAKDVNHPSLSLHKISGKSNWSVSVSDSYRISFNIEDGVIFCFKFGTHDEVY